MKHKINENVNNNVHSVADYPQICVILNVSDNI